LQTDWRAALESILLMKAHAIAAAAAMGIAHCMHCKPCSTPHVRSEVKPRSRVM